VKLIIYFLLLLVCIAFQTVKADPVLAPAAVNALLEYRAKLWIPKSEGKAPTQAVIRGLIERQTKFSMGVFESEEYTRMLTGTNLNTDKGVVALNSIKTFRIVDTEAKASGTLLTYDIAIEILVHNRILQDTQPHSMKILIPYDAGFYDPGCVDPHYDWPEYYFAFWEIFSPKCQKHIGKEVQAITGTVRVVRGPNPGVSPRYDRLFAQARARGEFRIAVLMSFDESTTKSADYGRKSFEWTAEQLVKKAGFVVEHRVTTPITSPYYELVQPGDANRPPTRISLSLSIADAVHPVVFARRAKWAFENADVVVYQGHSGLGENLKIQRLSSQKHVIRTVEREALEGPIRFNSNYQIYYFDACESLFWYTESYELAKRGKRNVDILTNGLVSLFDTQNAEFWKFLIPFVKQQTPSWMEIMESMEKPLKGQTYFLNVGAIR
jgi:hypothetical protein